MGARNAIILAAGMGTRLRGTVDDRPKGLLTIDGEAIVARSIALLREAGIATITIVAGYRAELYQAFAAAQPDVRIVLNDAFESTGSMASLMLGLEAAGDDDSDVLVLESDIVFEARALSIVLANARHDVTLMSGPTGAGDEVWVSAPRGDLVAMSKVREQLPDVAGEFVGITRLSPAACAAMRDAFLGHVARRGNGRMDYETGALVEVAQRHPIAALLVPDLCWGEIDDERQYARVVEQVWPVVSGGRDRGRVQ